MLIFIDNRSTPEAKSKLSGLGKVIEFNSEGIVDDYIAGHPDLFICQTPKKLITAPNLPKKYFKILDDEKIEYSIGDKKVESLYPACALYNCVVNNKFIIHKSSISDNSISEINLAQINVKQGMTRCSLLSIDENNYLTSDPGIAKTLSSKNLNVCLVDPKKIILPGKDYGLIGGTAGVYKNKVYFNGSLRKFPEGEKIRSFVSGSGYDIIELSDDPLFDGGGIFFVENK